VVKEIDRVPFVCATEPYLHCVLHYNDTVSMCREFSSALADETLRDPFYFADVVRAAMAQTSDN
jgi:hypothetical protein